MAFLEHWQNKKTMTEGKWILLIALMLFVMALTATITQEAFIPTLSLSFIFFMVYFVRVLITESKHDNN